MNELESIQSNIRHTYAELRKHPSLTFPPLCLSSKPLLRRRDYAVVLTSKY